MKITAIDPPKGLTNKQARDWLIAVGNVTVNNTAEELRAYVLAWMPGRLKTELNKADKDGGRGKGVNSPEARFRVLSDAFSDWMVSEKLIDDKDDDRFTLSGRGRGYCMASANARKKPEAAWNEVVNLLARVAWNNNNPANVSPLFVHDVVLFGSMAKKSAAEDYGDADFYLLVGGKGETPEDRKTNRADANNRDRNVWGLDQNWSRSHPDWSRLLSFWMKDGRSFLSQSGDAYVFQQFKDEGKPADLVSLLDRDWTGEKLTECDAVGCSVGNFQGLLSGLSEARENGAQTTGRERLQKACASAGCPWLLDVLAGREMTAEEHLDLAKRVIQPMVKKTAKRMSHHLFEQPAPNDFLPSDSMRALWFGSGCSAGAVHAALACDDQNGSALMACGGMMRATACRPEIANRWKEVGQAFLKTRSDSYQEYGQMELDGDLKHRYDLAPTDTYDVPETIDACARDGRWKAVREWVDRGGNPSGGWLPKMPLCTQPWALLVSILTRVPEDSNDHAEHIRLFQKAGFSLTEPDASGLTAQELARRIGGKVAKAMDEAMMTESSTISSMSSRVGKRRSHENPQSDGKNSLTKS